MNQYDPATHDEVFGDFVAELLTFDDEIEHVFANANELGLVVPDVDTDQLRWESDSFEFVPDDAA